MSIILPNLPFDKSDLAPHISAETLDYHHGKHHKTYVDNANKLIVGTEFESKSDIKEIIRGSLNLQNKSIFNNVAQSFNHEFYWNSMKKGGGVNPSANGALIELVKKYSDSNNQGSSSPMQFLIDKLKEAALTQFGSGWGWLVYNKKAKAIEVIKTNNAETPVTNLELVPLLTVDVWEHAYYIDHRNRRAEYLDKFFEHLVNWGFAEANLPQN
jgi:Fe-Mn family superoxide dismutase